MIVNGGFEDGLTGWQTSSTATHDSGSGEARTGAGCLVLDVAWGGITVSPEADQTLAGLSGRGIEVWLKLYQSDKASKVELLWDDAVVVTVLSSEVTLGEWTRISYVPSTDGELKIKASPNEAYGGSANAYWLVDDIAPTIGTKSPIATEVAFWADAVTTLTLGTDLFYSHMPDKPDECVCMYDVSAPVLIESQALDMDRFGLQAMCRSNSYATAQARALELHRKLVGFAGPLLSDGSHIVMVEPVMAPSSIGRDEEARSQWVVHLAFTVMSENDLYRS